MIKGEWSKVLIILILIPFTVLAVEIPSSETGKNILDKTGSTTKSFIKNIGEGINKAILSLSKNNDQAIKNWWENKARPWFLGLKNIINTYLSERIIIN